MNTAVMQHGFPWNGEDLTGWDLSEKMDGVRAFWDGAEMWSRGLNRIDIPQNWRDALPAGIALDGEIYHGPGGLYRCTTAARYGRFQPGMEFVVFDAPALSGNWRKRIACAKAMLVNTAVARVVPQWICTSTDHAMELLAAIQGAGGEGVMARAPDMRYGNGRTRELLKLKVVCYAPNFQVAA